MLQLKVVLDYRVFLSVCVLVILLYLNDNCAFFLQFGVRFRRGIFPGVVEYNQNYDYHSMLPIVSLMGVLIT